MHRRTFIASIGTMGFAGCLGSTGSGGQTYEATEPNGDGVYQPGEVHHNIENSPEHPKLELEVTELQIADGRMAIKYIDPTGDEGLFFQRMGYVALVYAGFVADGEIQTDRLDATVLDDFEEVRTEWYAEASWAETYNAGDVDAQTYGCKVAETVPIRPLGC